MKDIAHSPLPDQAELLKRGYLPKELPPLFDSSSFSYESMHLNEPAKRRPAALVTFSHSKYASVRRQLGIPNPCQYFQITKLVADQWKSLRQVWNQSTISKTKPMMSSDRAVEGSSEFTDLPQLRAEVRAAGRYLFKADISSFYHSIYTHSIPWALHGKEAAKANRVTRPTKKQNTVLWGNIADELTRNLQAGQTIGLPIGPDTSYVLAETILCAIDARLQQKLGDTPSFRFVDDYEFVCGSQPEAERALAVLQDSLAEFELRLNSRKTEITELPDALDTPWVEILGEFDLSPNARLSTRLVRYFTRAFELTRQHPGEPVLSYASRRLDDLSVEHDDALLLQRLLLQAAMADPGILRFVLRVFFEHRETGLEIDSENLQRALTQLIIRHGPLGHSSEVAWCIWAAVVFNIQLSRPTTTAIERMSDDVVALTAMFAEQHGVFESVPSKEMWESLVEAGTLFDEHWLLCFEAVQKGWIASSKTKRRIEKDEFFASLRDQGVEFIDSAVSPEIPELIASGHYR